MGMGFMGGNSCHIFREKKKMQIIQYIGRTHPKFPTSIYLFFYLKNRENIKV